MSSKSRPRAILFDLDDTIVDYGSAVQPSWRMVCERFAGHAGVEADTFYQEIRRQADWLWGDPWRHQYWRRDMTGARREIIRLAVTKLGQEAGEWIDAMAQLRTQLFEEMLVPFPGAIETLRTLRQQGVRLGMVTNGTASLQRGKVERFGLTPLFDSIIIEGEWGFGKPGFRVFHESLHLLQVAAEDTWMVGDKLEYDIAPAQTLGISGVWHDFEQSGIPMDAAVQPEYHVRSLHELLSLLRDR